MTLQVAPPEVGTGQDVRTGAEGQSGWLVVAEQECRDLWTSGRGVILLFLFSVLLSAITYLTSTNQALNFLEQRESVNLVLQFAVAVGALATLVVSADGISGERERGPWRRCSSRRYRVGRSSPASSSPRCRCGSPPSSSAFPTYGCSLGVGILGSALALGLCVGTLVAVGLGAIGLLISAACNSNKTSIAASIFLLLILFAPTQLPSGLPQGWFFDVLLRANPVASGLAYISSILVEGHSWTQDLALLITPLLTALVAGGALVFAGPRLVRLTGSDRRMRELLVIGLMAVALTWPRSCAAAPVNVKVVAEPAEINTLLGDRFMITTEITNTGATPSGEILAHLNVASIEGGVYVDPEDWSPSRSQLTSAGREPEALLGNTGCQCRPLCGVRRRCAVRQRGSRKRAPDDQSTGQRRRRKPVDADRGPCPLS